MVYGLKFDCLLLFCFYQQVFQGQYFKCPYVLNWPLQLGIADFKSDGAIFKGDNLFQFLGFKWRSWTSKLFLRSLCDKYCKSSADVFYVSLLIISV